MYLFTDDQGTMVDYCDLKEFYGGQQAEQVANLLSKKFGKSISYFVIVTGSPLLNKKPRLVEAKENKLSTA